MKMNGAAPITVVGATLADLSELMRLFRMMHAEGGLFPLDEKCTEEMFVRTLNKQQGIIGVIRGEGQELRAFICLLITRFWYTSEFHLDELWNYVSPEHRKSNYADILIRYAKHCSDELKIPLFIGVLTNKRMEAKVRLYRRRLGMPAGAFFVYNTEWISERATDGEIWKTHSRAGMKRARKPLGSIMPEVPSLLSMVAATTTVM
jgi:hypothetical protein